MEHLLRGRLSFKCYVERVYEQISFIILFVGQFYKTPFYLDFQSLTKTLVVFLVRIEIRGMSFYFPQFQLNHLRHVFESMACDWFDALFACYGYLALLRSFRDIALHILTAHDFTPDHYAQIKNVGFFFVLGAHQRGKLPLSSNKQVHLSFFLSLGVGHLLSFRKININEFSMQEKEFDFGNGNVVRSGNYNFHCILVITWYIYWAMLLLNEN